MPNEDKKNPDNFLSTLGAYLKKNREAAGVSLEEIVSSTKINISVLQYLESDRFDKLPPPVFVRGFIRAYLRYLGIDPKEALLCYELITTGTRSETDKSDKKKEEPKENTDDDKKGFSKFFGFIGRKKLFYLIPSSVFVLLLVLYLVLYSSVTEEKDKKDDGASSLVKVFTPKPAKKEVYPRGISLREPVSKDVGSEKEIEAMEETEEPVIVDVKKEDLSTELIHEVTVKALGDVWLRVQVDQKEPEELTLKKDQELVLKASDEIKILAGDASALLLNYEDQVIEGLGGRGSVRSIVIPGFGRWVDAMQ